MNNRFLAESRRGIAPVVVSVLLSAWGLHQSAAAQADGSPAGPFMDRAIAQLPAGSLICTVERKSICARGLCKSAPPSTWAFVNFSESEYAFCDKSHCNTESLPHGALEKGRYASTDAPAISGAGGWIAVFRADGDFEEVRLLGADTVISSGTCKPKT